MNPAPRRWLMPAAGPPLPGMHPILGSILANRGYTAATAQDLLSTSVVAHDPLTLKGMGAAVDAIAAAIAAGKKIAIYGDYDADGVTATALLVGALEKAGVAVVPYIPDRMTEGYGIHEAALKQLHAEGVGLVVSVDCGISSAEVAAGRPAGLDIVVTDHHLAVPGPSGNVTLPAVEAVVDPKQPGETYSFHGLAGVGVAWKLLAALEARGLVPHGSTEDGVWLALIGTIGDVMPLTDENRSIVRQGLERLAKNPPPGIRALAEEAGIRGEITAMDLAFQIVPRINAAGRMEDAHLALSLLRCTSIDEARKLATRLEAQNLARKQAVERAMEGAEAQVAKLPDNAAAIVVGDPAWPMGIVGLVAGRLAEKYGCPAFAASLSPPEAKGSARSHGTTNIVDVLSEVKQYLVRFGGHAPAAGFALDPKEFQNFARAVNNAVAKRTMGQPRSSDVVVDAVIEAQDLRMALHSLLARLEPCGQENRQPVLALLDTRILGVYPFGAEVTTPCPGGCSHQNCSLDNGKWVIKRPKHTRLLVKGGDGNLVSIVCWNTPGLSDIVKKGDRKDIAFSVEVNEWNGVRRLQLRLIDQRPATIAPPAPGNHQHTL